MYKDITLVIPTVGRETLCRSIQSVRNQSNSNWKIIIVFDNKEPSIKEENNISVIHHQDDNHKMFRGRGGFIRNISFNHITTDLVGFLDDDDTLSPDYVETALSEFNSNDIDILIFTMKKGERVIPAKENENITVGDVGISFCLKTEIIQKNRDIRFCNKCQEDFLFLQELKNRNYKYKISRKICYFVRPNNENINMSSLI